MTYTFLYGHAVTHIRQPRQRYDVPEFEVPAALLRLPPPEAERAAGNHRLTGGPVQQHRLELRSGQSVPIDG
ncbi:hypothetical protein ACFY0A_37945 [Streptomyces sp. NPDC001698]|uniref:hypothetical protein n=1 Tax=unclassified Streptomyces TaxID=2593676 RepID=UPI00368A21AF